MELEKAELHKGTKLLLDHLDKLIDGDPEIADLHEAFESYCMNKYSIGHPSACKRTGGKGDCGIDFYSVNDVTYHRVETHNLVERVASGSKFFYIRVLSRHRDSNLRESEERMLKEIIQRFGEEIKEKSEDLVLGLGESGGYEEVEAEVLSWGRRLCSEILSMFLGEVLLDEEVLAQVKRVGGRLGYGFVSYQEVGVRLGTGEEVRVRSPYFVKASSKRGKRKRGPNGRGCHLLLEVLGFLGRCSSVFVAEVVKMALLCPSLAVARDVLSSRGMAVDVKTIRRLCGLLGAFGLKHRGEVSLELGEDVLGKTVVVGVDGGRIRLRQKKRGQKKAGLKRSGFSTPWREPKLFTIYLLDASGGVERSFPPLHDATLGDADAMFSLLGEYLRQLGIAQAARVIFVGDGAPWIWDRVGRLREALSREGVEVFEVVDYYHAAAHLWKLVEVSKRLSEKERTRLYAKGKQALWEGNVPRLKQEMLQGTRGKVKKQVLKGMAYFETHASRMQYATFKAAGVPQGSGCVESAIRRVINLRLKAPGTFWSPKMAEVFLFLRAQVISGRWRVFLRNVANRVRHLWEASRRKRGYTETSTPEKPLLTYEKTAA